MKNKIRWVVFGNLIFFSLMLFSFMGQSMPVAAAANWWDKFGEPQYGGTITIRNAAINAGSFDPSSGMMGGGGGFATNLWLEGLAYVDWTLDRNIWSYPGGFTPIEYLKGLLAESWEQTNPLTITVHLRKGVHWQNKPPVNGREFTAKDVQFNYDRVLGTGSGYTVPNPFLSQQINTIKRVVATDKYTVKVQLKTPTAMGIYQLLNTMFAIVPPEWVALGGPPSNKPAAPPGPGGPGPGGPPPGVGGPLSDWKKVIGTGPWILSDFVGGTSMTFTKNPDYWGYDERHPKNKLPYADKVVQLAIGDPGTAIAAMRTGKIDMWTDMMGALTWQQASTIAKTNPEIVQVMLPRPAANLCLRCDTKPFNDIRVRKALQLALDLQSIKKGYYNNTEYGNPVGLVSPELKGWATPYKQWPQALKDEYGYNPALAKKLLAEAGYPKGFKTNAVAPSNQDTQLLQLIKSQFKEIGVDMEIKIMDPPTYGSFTAAGKFDQMVYADGMAGMLWSPANSLSFRVSNLPQINLTYNNDPAYDKLFNKFTNTSDPAEMKRLSAEADLYTLKEHWSVNIIPSGTPVIWQPYIKGYSGEILVDPTWAGAVRARLWIDKNLKK